EPGQQHFYGAVTLGHDTDQYVVVDDQRRPDPVVAHLAQGFDDHVAGTNMDQGATLLGQSVFDCAHRVPLVGPVLARPMCITPAAVREIVVTAFGPKATSVFVDAMFALE